MCKLEIFFTLVFSVERATQNALQLKRGDNHGKNDDAQSSRQPYRQAAGRRRAEAARYPDGDRH